MKCFQFQVKTHPTYKEVCWDCATLMRDFDHYSIFQLQKQYLTYSSSQHFITEQCLNLWIEYAIQNPIYNGLQSDTIFTKLCINLSISLSSHNYCFLKIFKFLKFFTQNPAKPNPLLETNSYQLAFRNQSQNASYLVLRLVCVLQTKFPLHHQHPSLISSHLLFIQLSNHCLCAMLYSLLLWETFSFSCSSSSTFVSITTLSRFPSQTFLLSHRMSSGRGPRLRIHSQKHTSVPWMWVT